MSICLRNGNSQINAFNNYDSVIRPQHRQEDLQEWSSGKTKQSVLNRAQINNLSNNIRQTYKRSIDDGKATLNQLFNQQLDEISNSQTQQPYKTIQTLQTHCGKSVEADHTTFNSTGNLNLSYSKSNINDQSINQNMNIKSSKLLKIGELNQNLSGPISQSNQELQSSKTKNIQAKTQDLFAWLDMSPPKDGKVVFNPEATMPSTSEFDCQIKQRKSEFYDGQKMTVKQKFADSKTDHTSANGSLSSVKSSPDTKVHSNKLEGVKVSSTAIKLIFEENDDQKDKEAGLPLYRQLGNRQIKTVFKPKTLRDSIENFDLGASIQVSKEQEDKWNNEVIEMINQVKNEFGPAQEEEIEVKKAAEEMTYEEMLESKDFFSFDSYKKQNQKVLNNTKKSTYRTLLNDQAAKKEKYDISSQFKFNVEILSDAAPTTALSKSDEEKKTVAQDANLDFLNSVIASSKTIQSVHHVNASKAQKKSQKTSVKAKVEKRQEKFFDHANYNKVPSASSVPMSLFE